MKDHLYTSYFMLRYPRKGEPHPVTGNPVTESEDNKFVAIDDASGGYPYPADIERGKRFFLRKEAESYRGVDRRGKFKLVEVKVIYELTDLDAAASCIPCDQGIEHGNCTSF